MVINIGSGGQNVPHPDRTQMDMTVDALDSFMVGSMFTTLDFKSAVCTRIMTENRKAPHPKTVADLVSHALTCARRWGIVEMVSRYADGLHTVWRKVI